MPDREKTPDKMTLPELRILVTHLNANFKRAVWIGTLAITILTGLGLNRLSDIESKARDKVDAAVSKGSEYFDLIVNGQSRIQAGLWHAAIPHFEAARALRPDDELVIYNLLLCYANAAEVDAGIRLIEDVEKSGLFSRKLTQTWTLLNAGRVLMLAGLDKKEHLAKAGYYLGRARRAAQLQKGGDIAYVLYAEAILEYVQGNEHNWRHHLRSLVAIDPRSREWPSSDRVDPWFQLLLQRFPDIGKHFDRVLRHRTAG